MFDNKPEVGKLYRVASPERTKSRFSVNFLKADDVTVVHYNSEPVISLGTFEGVICCLPTL